VDSCSSSSGTGKRVCSMLASIAAVSRRTRVFAERSRTNSLDRATWYGVRDASVAPFGEGHLITGQVGDIGAIPISSTDSTHVPDVVT